jgi:hypothetical protein
MSNKKIMGFIFVAVFIMVGFFSTHANAAAAWYTCTVTKAGPSGTSSVYIYLTQSATTPKFTNMSFTCRSGQENRQLAVALAALANGQKVYVNIDYTLASTSSRVVNAIMLLP